ncbi:glycosyltransferase family 4 protein [Halpernia frigidisoli]|uniref:Glycosyltransferase involved in cell wall bisynthesis n=1 Tax=Halpernia frigidisoli TaxID=1125876 RepID=A0A1I3FDW3_9FLAO|nr:glycosyltransferase family 1 protein [Halpernia frigidisoli]SFI09081.1 Glycosyltransferase involved in cell wall bisynthesis [Halpernia frigidisoli]
MKIHFFNRQFIAERISIEKVFSVIQLQLREKGFIVKIINNPFPLSQMFKAMWFFKKNQGDINHITGDIHWAAIFLNNNKTVLTIHDNVSADSYNSWWKKQMYLLIWIYLPVWKLKYITVISQKTKDEILKYCPNAENKIRVIPNPLTFGLFKREVVEKSAEETNLLLVGTRSNKNIERVLQASKNLKCHITIVGELSDEQTKLIAESSAKFSLKKFISDQELEQLYQISDILCFPSLYEGFGMPIIEAQAAGCTVITSDVEPMKSVAGNAALLVDPLDKDDIENKLGLLINDLNLRRELVQKGFANAKRFLPEEITQKYINLYKEIADGAGIID